MSPGKILGYRYLGQFYWDVNPSKLSNKLYSRLFDRFSSRPGGSAPVHRLSHKLYNRLYVRLSRRLRKIS